MVDEALNDVLLQRLIDLGEGRGDGHGTGGSKDLSLVAGGTGDIHILQISDAGVLLAQLHAKVVGVGQRPANQLQTVVGELLLQLGILVIHVVHDVQTALIGDAGEGDGQDVVVQGECAGVVVDIQGSQISDTGSDALGNITDVGDQGVRQIHVPLHLTLGSGGDGFQIGQLSGIGLLVLGAVIHQSHLFQLCESSGTGIGCAVIGSRSLLAAGHQRKHHGNSQNQRKELFHNK